MKKAGHNMDPILSKFDSKLFDSLSKSSSRLYFYYSDMKTNTATWSESAVEYFGLPSQVLAPGTIWDERVHPDDVDAYRKSFEAMVKGETPYHNCEYRAKNAEGNYVWVNCLGYMTYNEDGSPDFFAGFVTNMGTVNKIDPVTGLRTVNVFRSDLERLFSEKICGAAVQIDIDNFKRINSRHGYNFGDKVLYAIGSKVAEIAGNPGRVYRADGAQFVVIFKDICETRVTRNFITDFHRSMKNALEHIRVNGLTLRFEFKMGVTLFPTDGDCIDQIQNNIYYAIENAKNTKSDAPVFYSEELYEKKNEHIRLTDAVRTSVENHIEGFRIVLQPIIDAETGKLSSAEALLRWRNPAFPKASPMDFIPILEESRNIVPVGKWIIDTALRTVAEWSKIDTPVKLKHINMNFSYIQFMDESLEDYVVEKLDEYGLSRNTLIAELTESCRVEYTDKLARILQKFHDDGIQIALDDFGTGYASLMVLKDIPADIVKIDHTMTRTIRNREKDRNIVEFIIAYCNNMDIDVCTEGVETDEILGVVKTAGAKYIQGYYYDKPLELDEFFEKYLKNGYIM